MTTATIKKRTRHGFKQYVVLVAVDGEVVSEVEFWSKEAALQFIEEKGWKLTR